MKALRSKPAKRGNGKRGPDKKPRAKRRTGPPKPPPPGKGRVAGTIVPLPPGAVSSIKGLRYRVPLGTPELLGDLADEAFDAVVSVMRGENPHGAMARLGAARVAREEICGVVVQKHEHTGAGGAPIAIQVEDARAKVRAQLFKPEGTE